jgi:hydrogenase maturation protease
VIPAALVVGLGNPDRGDDGVGPAVAQVVLAMDLPGVRVVADAEPLHLLDDDVVEDVVVVVDAARSGRPPGTVQVLDALRTLPPWTGTGSTHTVGIDLAVELLGALGRLPGRLALIAVEGECFDAGAALSPSVRAAVPVAADTVLTELGPVLAAWAAGGGR